ncbi:hypothetical protein JIP1600_3000009 [Flavobacterium psychrophilum]|nr:hypothetical protein JIP1600_3000009 [Flavobacterium psychrophilum]
MLIIVSHFFTRYYRFLKIKILDLNIPIGYTYICKVLKNKYSCLECDKYITTYKIYLQRFQRNYQSWFGY